MKPEATTDELRKRALDALARPDNSAVVLAIIYVGAEVGRLADQVWELRETAWRQMQDAAEERAKT